MATNARDELGDRIVAAGFAPNGFLLDLNGSISVPAGFELPAPWNLPSRLFRFPIEVAKPTSSTPRTIGLRHPGLAAHPFVQHVEAALGMKLDPDGAPNQYGYSTCQTGLWHHAVDLISEGKWQELLATSHLTTTRNIFNAVAYGLRYSTNDEGRARKPHLSTSSARAIMDELGASEPTNRAATLRELSKPSPCNPEGKGRDNWPINDGHKSSAEDRAWSFIFGVEDGWFEYDRSGFLNWSEKGRDRYAAGDSATFVEHSGQVAFAF